MNDPYVAALRYRIEHSRSTDYSEAEPIDHEEDDFSIRVEDGRVCFLMKERYATVDSAKEVVEPYIRSWELDAALRSQPGVFKLKFERAKIERPQPIPGKHEVSADPTYWTFETSVPEVTVSRPYPRPPAGAPLERNDDVFLMLARLEDYFDRREKLTTLAYLCLTTLEDLTCQRRRKGRRSKVARKFMIERDVLDKVGNLSSEKGGQIEGRKYGALKEDLTPFERQFLENAVKVFIRRLAEKANPSNGPLQWITLDDFPELGR